MGGDEASERMAAQAKGCSRLCHCGVALCINSAHQPWECQCGHPRTAHFHYMAAFYGVSSNYTHPHQCLVPHCGCTALRYPEHVFYSPKELLRRLESMDDEMEAIPYQDED